MLQERLVDVSAGTCSTCVHIKAVKYDHRNIFFCTAQAGTKNRKERLHGLEIKKKSPACSLKEFTDATHISITDGHYGTSAGRIKR